jgi:hypothetical protein
LSLLFLLLRLLLRNISIFYNSIFGRILWEFMVTICNIKVTACPKTNANTPLTCVTRRVLYLIETPKMDTVHR